VAEVGGLFLKPSPDKLKAILETAEKNDARALQPSAHSLKSNRAHVGPCVSPPRQKSWR